MKKLRAKNTNKFKKNNRIEFTNVSTSSRERENINVEDTPDCSNVPSCAHGPCLLFSNKSGERWFACAVYRQSKECKYRVFLDVDGKLRMKGQHAPTIITRPLEDYGSAKKTYFALKNKGVQPYWCGACSNFTSSEHQHAKLSGPFIKLPPPTSVLSALQDDKGEAQYWFSDDTLNILQSTLKRQNFESVLCIGAPSVFELFRGLSNEARRWFLLDIDDRLSLFYSEDEFARYSMLTDYFFHECARNKLRQFFKSAKRLAVICDPPFGVYVKALMRSLDALKLMAIEVNPNITYNHVIFLPLFVGKHILRSHADFSMIDFKVTYKNHTDFARADRSIVRIFIDMENRLFQLPAEMGYRYCSPCRRFVANANVHCLQCDRCTSLDGSKYTHCKVCEKCFKATYTHCRKCRTCHLRGRCLRNGSEK